jgi:hypothetical protein
LALPNEPPVEIRNPSVVVAEPKQMREERNERKERAIERERERERERAPNALSLV